MTAASKLAIRYEHYGNVGLARAADLLSEYSTAELCDLAIATMNREPFPRLWEDALPAAVALLVIPTIWAEIQRRMEVMDLEGHGDG